MTYIPLLKVILIKKEMVKINWTVKQHQLPDNLAKSRGSSQILLNTFKTKSIEFL